MWERKYHVVFIPKCRKKTLGNKRNFVGQNFVARRYYLSTVGRDARVHSKPGAREQAPGANQSVALSGNRKVAQSGPALATPHSRFERLTT